MVTQSKAIELGVVPGALTGLPGDLVLTQVPSDFFPLATFMAEDHEVMVWPRRDGFPFPSGYLNLTTAVDACALAHERDGKLVSDLLGRIPQSRVPTSEHLLVLLAARVPVHAPQDPRAIERPNAPLNPDRLSPSVGADTKQDASSMVKKSDGRGGRSHHPSATWRGGLRAVLLF
jgi:hypothetical protein